MDKDKIKAAIIEAKKINEEYHYLNEVNEQLALSSTGAGVLSEYTISIKDGIVVKDVESKASSKILTGYKPLFDATVVERVKNAGGVIIGKAVQDEFGFGSFATNVGIGIKAPLNPIDKTRATGGSSGGCGGFTKKTEFKHISLAESTGGSIVCPASFCGVVGLCPTYGRVSRNGLIDYGNSLDKIGPIAKNVHDVALMLEVISGQDPKDNTTSEQTVDEYTSYLGKDIKGMKIGILKDCFGEGVDKHVEQDVRSKIEILKKLGAIVEEISLPLANKYSLSVYYLVATSEASTNLAKFSGMRYGEMDEPNAQGFNEYFSKIRSQNIGREAKRRIILGTFARMSGFRDAYYIKAAKVRTKIINEYKEAFKKFDALICPTMPFVAPKFTDIDKMTPLQTYKADIMLVGPNIAGMPHLTVPAGNSAGMPSGILIIGDHFNEKNLIQIGSAIEKHNQ